MLREELAQKDVLQSLNANDELFEQETLAEDQLKVQVYIQKKIAEENRGLLYGGKERPQHELFPSLSSNAKNAPQGSRNVIVKANETTHRMRQELAEQPINQYFFQPAQIHPVDQSKAWQGFVQEDDARFSVR